MEAIVAALKRNTPVGQIADQFGVSEPLVRFRVNKTGAQLQIRRSRGG
jgi:DNA-binding Lrp family transcriptional regulator